MLDIVLISLAILSSVIQLVISIAIIYYKIKCKRLGLQMISNLWFDYIPHCLFGFTLFINIYSLTHSDSALLGIVIGLTIAFIFNIQILIYSKDSLFLITFPFNKEEFRSLRQQNNFFILENDKHQKIINLSPTKIKKIMRQAYGDFDLPISH
jgi:hypothetical protein